MELVSGSFGLRRHHCMLVDCCLVSSGMEQLVADKDLHLTVGTFLAVGRMASDKEHFPLWGKELKQDTEYSQWQVDKALNCRYKAWALLEDLHSVEDNRFACHLYEWDTLRMIQQVDESARLLRRVLKLKTRIEIRVGQQNILGIKTRLNSSEIMSHRSCDR